MGKYLFGVVIGAVCTALVTLMVVIPRVSTIKARYETLVKSQKTTIDEYEKTSQECLAVVVKLKDTCQSVIDVANYCADLLWTATPDDLKVLRAQPEPEHLPDLSVSKATLPSPTVTPISSLTIGGHTFL